MYPKKRMTLGQRLSYCALAALKSCSTNQVVLDMLRVSEHHFSSIHLTDIAGRVRVFDLDLMPLMMSALSAALAATSSRA